MADAALVNVLNARDELEVELACLLLGQPRVPDDVVKQLAAAAVFHDHVELLFGFNNLVKLNDVRMSDLLQNFDFSRDSFDILLIIDLVLLQDFDGHFLARKRMLAQLDLSKSSLAEMLACIF